ncbi:hypothetical protein CcI6DRAFT_04714 [Frankia sp. CcI6]|nr:hypothetical protein CcI6DRAFT_04714 [Frankia sp. CcI6]OAA18470.1 hypothetical protein AAY23_11275 [Frankia casuarinae]
MTSVSQPPQRSTSAIYTGVIASGSSTISRAPRHRCVQGGRGRLVRHASLFSEADGRGASGSECGEGRGGHVRCGWGEPPETHPTHAEGQSSLACGGHWPSRRHQALMDGGRLRRAATLAEAAAQPSSSSPLMVVGFTAAPFCRDRDSRSRRTSAGRPVTRRATVSARAHAEHEARTKARAQHRTARGYRHHRRHEPWTSPTDGVTNGRRHERQASPAAAEVTDGGRHWSQSVSERTSGRRFQECRERMFVGSKSSRTPGRPRRHGPHPPGGGD